MTRRLNELENYKRTQDLKADQYQCKTDPILLDRVAAIEKDLKELKAPKAAPPKPEPPKPEPPKAVAATPPKPLEPPVKKNEPLRVDWIYDLSEAHGTQKDLRRPLMLAFSQSKKLCPKCASVRENCYANGKIFSEISTKFVPYWAPTGWSEQSFEYEVTGFPTVVIEYGSGQRKSFVPSEDPERFLKQLREYE